MEYGVQGRRGRTPSLPALPSTPNSLECRDSQGGWVAASLTRYSHQLDGHARRILAKPPGRVHSEDQIWNLHWNLGLGTCPPFAPIARPRLPARLPACSTPYAARYLSTIYHLWAPANKIGFATEYGGA